MAAPGPTAPPVPPEARTVRFPADAGCVDVTKPPYNAPNDGIGDATAAIQRALDDHPAQRAIIYIPKGRYLISDTLRWGRGAKSGTEQKRTTLQGESEAETVIVLKERAPGFDNPTRPKAMVWTGAKPAQRFGNEVRNLTLDVGRNNPGAAALQFNASNQGSVRNVTLRGLESGVIGLDLRHTDEIGPCLIRDVTVLGFDRGVDAGFSVNSMTFERLRLEGQRTVGLRNRGQIIMIRGLIGRNAVPMVENGKGGSFMILLDADLQGSGAASRIPAVSNAGSMLARNVRVRGYQNAITNTDQGATVSTASPAGSAIEEWTSHPVTSLFPSAARTLGLPVSETPEPAWDPLDQWIAPQAFGLKLTTPIKGRNDLAALQKAIDAGKGTVYLPNGIYQIDGDLIVRGAVRRIIGCGARLRGKGRIVIADGIAPVVMIERIEISYSPIAIVHSSPRTLVLSGMVTADYRTEGRAGPVFIDDVVGGPFLFKNQNVWARQINPEQDGLHVSNQGGNLWILGLKTERRGVLVETINGRTEILGGHNYSTMGPKGTPAFTVENGSLSLSMGESNHNKSPYIAQVRETRGKETRTLYADELPPRGSGSLIVLYSGQVSHGPQTKPIVRTAPAPVLPPVEPPKK